MLYDWNWTSSKGDLYDEDQILQWLLTQKDPSGEVIEDLEGEELLNLIRESDSLAVYFCKSDSPSATASCQAGMYL